MFPSDRKGILASRSRESSFSPFPVQGGIEHIVSLKEIKYCQADFSPPLGAGTAFKIGLCINNMQ